MKLNDILQINSRENNRSIKMMWNRKKLREQDKLGKICYCREKFNVLLLDPQQILASQYFLYLSDHLPPMTRSVGPLFLCDGPPAEY